MANLLVYAKDNVHIDPIVDRRGCYKKGYVVTVNPDTFSPARSEKLPNFILVRCPEVSVEVGRAYNSSWEQTVDYTVNSADAATGKYNLTIFGNNRNVSGEAAITKDQVEAFLLRWNCVVNGFADNSVTFDIALWQALQSEGFWNRDVSAFTFTLDSYTQSTGVAEVTVTGIADDKAVETAIRAIEERGGVVSSSTSTSVSFSIDRSDLVDKFKSDVSQKTRGTWCRKQYYLSEAVVDQAIAMLDTFDSEEPPNQLTWAGQIELTQAELLAALNNKLEE